MRQYSSKLDGCFNKRLAERLYQVVNDGWCDEETGSVCEAGWYGLIVRKPPKRSFIVSEDTQGFFDYADYPTEKEARKVFEDIVFDLTPDEGEEDPA